jgi:hypothetical protein
LRREAQTARHARLSQLGVPIGGRLARHSARVHWPGCAGNLR